MHSLSVASDEYGENAFVGAIRDLRFFNYALSEEEAGLRVHLADGYVDEQFPAGTLTGKLEPSVNDPRPSITLVPGAGDMGNSVVRLKDDRLLTTRVLDYEETPVWPVRLRATLENGYFTEGIVRLRVGNLFAPLVETLLPGADNRLSGRLHPDGGLSVTSTGFRISGSPFHGDGDTRFVEADDLGPDGGFSAPVTDLTPGTTYYYQAFATNAEGTGYGVLKKFLAPRHSVASGPWGDAKRIAGSGWYQTAIGLVYLPGEQWAYHQHFGWIYVQGDSPGDLWLWMEGSGWHWTARRFYPYLYRDSLPGWVYLLKSIDGVPVFYNTVSGQVEYGDPDEH